ncbi:MAG TPA: hypothetical protein VIN10_11800 [Bacteroidales bacterium]
MEQLIEQLKAQNPSANNLALKLEALIRVVNEINPEVFDRVKISAEGNPIKIG